MWCKVTFCGSLGNVRPKTKKDKKKRSLFQFLVVLLILPMEMKQREVVKVWVCRIFFSALALNVNLAMLSP